MNISDIVIVLAPNKNPIHPLEKVITTHQIFVFRNEELKSRNRNKNKRRKSKKQKIPRNKQKNNQRLKKKNQRKRKN